jgi:multicomponent Na+:H+ antiporter subunit E
MLLRLAALFCWAFGVWVLLTWTLNVEQLVFGAFAALAVALALAPLGDVVRPWRLLRPRALAGATALLLVATARIVVANLRLSRRIWNPRRPLASGMVITPTRERSAWGLTAVGLVTSVIVDNQLVDLDRERGELQYHAVAVPDDGPDQARREINGPVERLLGFFEQDGQDGQ